MLDIVKYFTDDHPERVISAETEREMAYDLELIERDRDWLYLADRSINKANITDVSVEKDGVRISFTGGSSVLYEHDTPSAVKALVFAKRTTIEAENKKVTKRLMRDYENEVDVYRRKEANGRLEDGERMPEPPTDADICPCGTTFEKCLMGHLPF